MSPNVPRPGAKGDRWRLAEQLDLLVHDRGRGTGESMAAALDRAVGGAPWVLGAAGAGLCLLDSGERLRHATASGPAARALGTAQERLGAGPAHDAVRQLLPVTARDVTGDPRWVDLRHLVDPKAVRAVLAVPVTLPDGDPLGVLCLHQAEPRDWEVARLAAGVAYAETLGTLVAFGLLAGLRGVLLVHLLGALRTGAAPPRPGATPAAGAPARP